MLQRIPPIEVITSHQCRSCFNRFIFTTRLTFTNKGRIGSKNNTLLHTPIMFGRNFSIFKLKKRREELNTLLSLKYLSHPNLYSREMMVPIHFCLWSIYPTQIYIAGKWWYHDGLWKSKDLLRSYINFLTHQCIHTHTCVCIYI